MCSVFVPLMSLRSAAQLTMNRIISSGLSCRVHRVYKITAGNKKYVGQTVKMLEERLKEHARDSSNCTLLKQELQKSAKYDVDVLAITGSHNVDAMERVAIVLEGSMSPVGLNMTTGGAGVKFPDDKYEVFASEVRDIARHMKQGHFVSWDELFMKKGSVMTEDEFKAIKRLVLPSKPV